MRWSPVAALRAWVGRQRSSADGTDEGREGDDPAADAPGEDEDRGFVRSRLDASVLFAHGTRSRRVDESIDEVQERAADLEAADADRDLDDH